MGNPVYHTLKEDISPIIIAPYKFIPCSCCAYTSLENIKLRLIYCSKPTKPKGALFRSTLVIIIQVIDEATEAERFLRQNVVQLVQTNQDTYSKLKHCTGINTLINNNHTQE